MDKIYKTKFEHRRIMGECSMESGKMPIKRSHLIIIYEGRRIFHIYLTDKVRGIMYRP